MEAIHTTTEFARIETTFKEKDGLWKCTTRAWKLHGDKRELRGASSSLYLPMEKCIKVAEDSHARTARAWR